MARTVVAIVGSYRRGGTVDTVVDAVLSGAREVGAETKTIRLVERHIEYCRNCRACTQEKGERRQACGIEDDVAGILDAVEKADAVVLASPVNFYNVTAVFRTFLERLVGCAYWPWGQGGPKPRAEYVNPRRRAVLIASAAAPGFLLPIATGAPRALRVAAQCLGARPVAKIWVGLAARQATPVIRVDVMEGARSIGRTL